MYRQLFKCINVRIILNIGHKLRFLLLSSPLIDFALRPRKALWFPPSTVSLRFFWEDFVLPQLRQFVALGLQNVTATI